MRFNLNINIDYICDYNGKRKTANVRDKMANTGENYPIFVDLSRNCISLTSFVNGSELQELLSF